MGNGVGCTRKKLEAAALHWAGLDAVPEVVAAKVDGGVIAQLAFFGFEVGGLTPEGDGKKLEPVCEVWEENWASLDFFCAVATQWTYTSGMTVQRMGLDYACCESTARALGVRWRDRFADLRLMEAAVLKGEREARAERAE